jgi:L-fuculose-phosphate aldolase
MSSSSDPRPLMVELARLLYQRYLTNSAGGNISCRVDGRIYITPRNLGSKQRWQLREDMVLVLDSDLNPLEGDRALVSRESQTHFACYKHYPEINGVIHAHARYLTVFAEAGQPVPPASEYTDKYGVIEVVPPFPSHSKELADAVVAQLAPHRDKIRKVGYGLLLARHGVLTVGRDLADAYDILDRLEWSAHTLLMSALLPGIDRRT